MAALVGADTASLRRFGLVDGEPVPLSIVDVADDLGISVRTVESHLRSIFFKCKRDEANSIGRVARMDRHLDSA